MSVDEKDLTDSNAPMRIVKSRRDYNTWVANETIEDYALRYTPQSFRKWSIFRVSNTALGAISFLVLEVIGATLAINYGFVNAFWAILAISLIIFSTSLPISYYAAKYGLDMDLLTRGAGFGYIGSTISSFIYATFTFILFALEAVIMAYALGLYFEMPLYVWYLISAIIIIPLVTHGVTLISRIQVYTQPVWLVLTVLPFIFILIKDPQAISGLVNFAGESGYDSSFNFYMFGTAVGIGMALIPQVGEQVDFLRFMPVKTAESRWRWYLGVFLAGPGWIFIGMAKMFGGMFLAYLTLMGGRSLDEAVNPTYMYQTGFSYVFANAELVLVITVFFVVLSQTKINITNAYAGSLAWSNFFARLTHSHPGRVVWLIFNVLIATMLMLLDVPQALEQVLGLYSNVAVSWVTAVVVDLVINKPLGLSPKGIEFRRAYLYDINPVGVGSMIIASVFSVLAFTGVFGLEVQSFSSFVAIFTVLIFSPLIAWMTKGKYYLARKPFKFSSGVKNERCSICEREYEIEDVAYCPAYQGPICSLCCCLDARCDDACKPYARVGEQWLSFMKKLLPESSWSSIHSQIGKYVFLMMITFLLLASIFSLIYLHIDLTITDNVAFILSELKVAFLKAFAALILVSGVIVWWLVLTSQSRNIAQQESNSQTHLLQREIELHEQTDKALQQARNIAEQANEAKSRYISGISHELRTPLNSILGYAQLLDNDSSEAVNHKNAIKVILRSGDHLLSLIEGTLDIAKIENGKLQFDVKSLKLPEYLQYIINMFEVQSKNKGLGFEYKISSDIPNTVRGDQKRLSQILLNLIGNAVKYTNRGLITVHFSYAREFLSVEVNDTGAGISNSELESVFEPFYRSTNVQGVGGTGLGLTVSKLLTELMGGTLEVESELNVGSTFKVRLFLPMVRVSEALSELPMHMPIGYRGVKRKLLVVDNEPVDRELLVNILEPLGFEIKEVGSGLECLRLYQVFQPDIIFMDLAMPEMDGWETIHVIKNIHHSNVKIGVISANAFDKNLDNSLDISSKDFILKPVNIMELISWIGQKLKLEWVQNNNVDEHLSSNEVYKTPSEEVLNSIMEMLEMGYIEGVKKLINELELEKVGYGLFISEMHGMLERFELSNMKDFIEEKIENV